MLIGITGGIGAGKSIVSRILRLKGYEVYDCDSEARRLMDLSTELQMQIADILGAECLLEDGSLNRKEIAAKVFGNVEYRSWLNGEVHSMVRADILKHTNRCSAGVMFVESAIMKVSQLDKMCDAIWLVTADDEIRLQRASLRDNTDSESIRMRMESQRWEYEGFDCDNVIEIINDGVVPLLPQIEKQIKILKNA